MTIIGHQIFLIDAICQIPIYYDYNSGKTDIFDVTLACEDEASEAHKVVQLNRSPLFSLRTLQKVFGEWVGGG